MSSLVGIDVDTWSEETGELTVLHMTMCERHYGEWAMEPDSFWTLCDNPHAMDDFCEMCEIERRTDENSQDVRTEEKEGISGADSDAITDDSEG